jgi:uncharacterized protein (TIGR00725 family)
MLRKLPIIAVFGQGTPLKSARRDLAKSVGALVAGLGAHLLTGGGYGVMEAAAEGFVGIAGRAGFSIGIVPREPDGPLDSINHDLDGRPYPNPFVEIAIHTPLPPRVGGWLDSPARNHINVLSADGIIALPGGPGTRNEIEMAAIYRGETNRSPSERRTVLVGPPEEFEQRHKELFVHAGTLSEAERHLRNALAARGHSI